MKLKKIFIVVLFLVLTLLIGCKKEAVLIIEKLNYSLNAGEIVDVEYIIENETDSLEVLFNVLDSSVVSIKDGKMEGLKEGETLVEVYLSTNPQNKITLNVSVTSLERLVVDKREYIIELGSEEKVDYKTENLLENTKVIFASDDDDIAKVEDGKIKGLKVGVTTIKVYLSSLVEEVIEIKVDVRDLEKLTVSITSYNLMIGDSVNLDYTTSNLLPTTTVEINSLDETICKIVDGKIVGISKGSTTIEIYLSAKPTDKVTVSVEVKEELAVEITNKIDEIPLFTEYTLEGIITDELYTDTLTWSSSDSDILSIDSNGKLELKNIGKVTITLATTKEEGISDSFEVEIIIDPFVIFDLLAIDEVLVQNVTSYGNTTKTQMVYGSVSRYLFEQLNIIEKIITINENEYTGMTATPAILAAAEPLKKVRTGILLEDLQYIIYHDSGNNNPGTNALNHANYMVSEWNVNDRARSWHYTVDENCVYHHIPNNEVTWQGDSYDAYAKSIGIETCVDEGSDLYKTWQNMGKLLAMLLTQNDLTISSIKQHFDMSGKDCPKTLRNNNLYPYAISLVEGELMVLQYLSDYDITFTSLSKEYLDDSGKVIKQPLKTTNLAYEITVVDSNGNKESKVYYSTIKGSNSSLDTKWTDSQINVARDFDNRVATLNRVMTVDDVLLITDLRNEYYGYDEATKSAIATFNFLIQKEYEMLTLFKVDTDILINEVHLVDPNDSSKLDYSYIELYNSTSETISLKDCKVEVKIENGTFTYYFNDDAIIYAGSYYLIGFNDLTETALTELGALPLPDVVIEFAFPKSNLQIVIGKGTVSFDELSIGESDNSIVFLDGNKTISRKHLIDTDNNIRDFENISLPTPLNSRLETSTQSTNVSAFVFDYNVLKLNREITEYDENAILELKSEFEKMDSSTLEKVKTKELYDKIYATLLGIKNPNVKIVYDVIQSIPKQIVDDYLLPVVEGVTYSYVEGEDTSYYNLETGEYKKLSFEAKMIKISVSCGDVTDVVTINFGVAKEGQKIIFGTNATAPSGGKTSDGYGTYETQKARAGFGGVAIACNNNLYFIGKNCLITLTKPSSGNALTRTDLRPLGGDQNFNNYGIVNGVATQYAGTGALYYNSSDIGLSFDLSDTYGRNNSGAYGYFKVIFSPSITGGYYVSRILPNSGTNDTTTNVQVTLLPGEYLWTPHTYETNVDGGTWFINPASSTSGGVLVQDAPLEIINYKNIDQ